MRFGGAAGHISSLQIARFTKSGHRVSVPVRPSQTVFAQFRHISGIPAASGQNTVPLSRVQLLNSLIDNLQRITQDSSYNAGTINASPERTDALIKQYAAELHQAIKARPEAFGTLSGSTAGGMVFNVGA